MAWPTAVTTTGMDADTDALPRSDILDLTTKFNAVLADRGAADGICDLDGSGLVPVARLPAKSAALSGMDGTAGLVEQTGTNSFSKRAIGSSGGVQLYDAATAKTNVKQTFTKQQTPMSGALTDNATINWDGDSNGQIVTVTLGGNRTMAAPTNIVQNTMYLLRVAQDATGSRLLTWDAAFKFGSAGAPTLSTGVSNVDFISFVGGASGTLECLGTRLNVV